mgnify:CR=1 FL=1
MYLVQLLQERKVKLADAAGGIMRLLGERRFLLPAQAEYRLVAELFIKAEKPFLLWDASSRANVYRRIAAMSPCLRKAFAVHAP